MRPLRPARQAVSSSSTVCRLQQCPSHLHHRPRPRSLHTSTINQAQTSSTTKKHSKPGHRSAYRSITAAEMELVRRARADLYASYSKQDKAELAKLYSPAQLAAIEAGEAAISPVHLAEQGRIRDDTLSAVRDVDPHSHSRIQPVIDKRLKRLREEGFDYSDQLIKSLGPNAQYAEVPDEEIWLEQLADVMLDPGAGGLEQDQPLNAVTQAIEHVRNAGKDPKRETLELGTGRDLLAETWLQMTEDPDNYEPTEDMQKLANDIMNESSSSVDLTEEQSRLLDTGMASAEDFGDENEANDEAYWEQLERDTLEQKRKLESIPRPRISTSGAADSDKPHLRPLLQRLMAAIPAEESQVNVAPTLPRIQDPRLKYDDSEATKSGEEPTGSSSGSDEAEDALYDRLSQTTGRSVDQIRRYRVRKLVFRQVTNQTRLGKINSAYILAVAGDENGMVGIGEGKAADITDATVIAKYNAIRNMKPIRRYEDRTIYGEVRGKVGAVEITMSARPPGFGLRCSHTVFEIARAAGLSDLSAKNLRSRNPMNVAKAVWEALLSQRDPEEVARARGKKLVDVRKVYYAGLN